LPTAEATNILDTAMRTFFGSPPVTTFIMWGFWEPAMDTSKVGVALADANWDLTPSGETYTNRMAGWTTETDLITDANGQVSFSGFHGGYQVIVAPPMADASNFVFQLTAGTTSSQATFVVDENVSDTDSDGIADYWELRHAGNLTNMNENTNSDTDPILDGDEYLLDYNPNVSNELFSLGIALDLTDILVTFDSTNTRLYTTEFNQNLLNPAGWQVLETGQTGSNGLHTVTDAVADDRRTYRVGVHVP
jgi:hypothetical protein